MSNDYKAGNGFLMAGILFMVFILFTIAVMFVDVQPVGPVNPATGEASSVGFATMNMFFHSLFGEDDVIYRITDHIVNVAMVVFGSFALTGFLQMVGRRSLFKVDLNILILGALYLAVFIFYFMFEYASINFRPVIMDGELEASYPSSHTMVAVCVFISFPGQFRHYFRKRTFLCGVVDAISITACLFMILGRLVSGCHWFTDIIGSVLLSLSFVTGYKALLSRFCKDF